MIYWNLIIHLWDIVTKIDQPMNRRISEELLDWKNSQSRMPLVLNGARQVGKTYILEQFGKAYFDRVLYLNMEVDTAFGKFLEENIAPDKIIQYLEAVNGVEIVAESTLLFFDEIQVSERALTSLKYFCEQAPHYYVVAAGSLFGVALNRKKYSYPVGKVQEMNLYPLDFEEFLWALNKTKLAEEIKVSYLQDRALPESLHRMALELFQQYFIVGGMPAAVSSFIETSSFVKVQQIQNAILHEYVADMAKYSDATTSIKIRACYQSIPAQLAKENAKFQYKVVQRGGTATIFGESIEWLVFAGIVLKCQRLDHGLIPLNAYVDLVNFKLYMGDIGFLTLRSEIPMQMILSEMEIDNTFIGAMTENYVAQAFASKGYKLVYWQSEGKAEVDFVLQLNDKIIPIEVKKGTRNCSRSLGVLVQKYDSSYAIRISKKNFGFENGIKSVPLYAVFCI